MAATVVGFDSPELSQHVAAWSKQWPNVSIKTWTALSQTERDNLQGYITEEEPNRGEVAAFICGMRARAPGRKAVGSRAGQHLP